MPSAPPQVKAPMKLYSLRARAPSQQIRLVMAECAQPFEEIFPDENPARFAQECKELGGHITASNIPLLVNPNGKVLASTTAIVRYLGRQHGYYPADPDKAYDVDMLLALADELRTEATKAVAALMKGTENAAVAFTGQILPIHLQNLNRLLGPELFTPGGSLSIADIS